MGFSDNNFNLLRFVLASLVIFSHVPELQYGNRDLEILTQIFHTISFGELAVDGFFIVRGYLIVKSWTSGRSAYAFLAARVFRIYPAFFIACIISAFLVGPLSSSPGYFHRVDYTDFLCGLLRLSLQGIPDVFYGSYNPVLNASLWTIPYEFNFYITVLLLGVLRVFEFRVLWLMMLISFLAGYFLYKLGISISGSTYLRFGGLFFAGGFFYLYRDVIPWHRNYAILAFGAFIAMLFFDATAELGLPIFFGYSMIYFAKNSTYFLWFNRFPDVSYGIYLYAWPINKMIFWWWPSISTTFAVTLVFLLSCFMGNLSWRFVEAPAMLFKKKMMSRFLGGV